MGRMRACLQIARSAHRLKCLLYRGQEKFAFILINLYSCLYHHPHWELWFQWGEEPARGASTKNSWFLIELQYIFFSSRADYEKYDNVAQILLFIAHCFAENKQLWSQRQFKQLGNSCSCLHSLYPVHCTHLCTNLPPAEQEHSVRLVHPSALFRVIAGAMFILTWPERVLLCSFGETRWQSMGQRQQVVLNSNG